MIETAFKIRIVKDRLDKSCALLLEVLYVMTETVRMGPRHGRRLGKKATPCPEKYLREVDKVLSVREIDGKFELPGSARSYEDSACCKGYALHEQLFTQRFG